MKYRFSNFAGHSRLEQEAADWIARNYERLNLAEKAEFELWLSSDVRHAEIYAELEETWKLLDRARDEPAAGLDARRLASAGGRRFIFWLVP